MAQLATKPLTQSPQNWTYFCLLKFPERANRIKRRNRIREPLGPLASEEQLTPTIQPPPGILPSLNPNLGSPGFKLIQFCICPVDVICSRPHSTAPVRGLMHIAFVQADCSCPKHKLVRAASDHETWFSKETACYSAKTQCSFRLRKHSCAPPYTDNERHHSVHRI